MVHDAPWLLRPASADQHVGALFQSKIVRSLVRRTKLERCTKYGTIYAVFHAELTLHHVRGVSAVIDRER
ncbi:hypothetical protein ACFCZT_27815 [Streptomyces sp. NPDC056230]|uniref:hypothetical protein n=1 Tax=Streptomyces sp. NPDC056230 TaxID=3345754 RepID=UPI0035D9E753